MTLLSTQSFVFYPYDAYIYHPTPVSTRDKSFLAAAAKLAQTSDNRFKI